MRLTIANTQRYVIQKKIHRRAFLTSAISSLGVGGCSSGFASSDWLFYENNPVLGGDVGICFDPTVIRDDGRYKMWFSWRSRRCIGYTESTDRITWRRPLVAISVDLSLQGEVEVNRPSVVKLDDGTFRLWFTSQSEKHSEIRTAISSDGVRWKRSSAVSLIPLSIWEQDAVMCPDVHVYRSGQYRMYYSAGGQYEPDAIGLCISVDGDNWKRVNESPIFSPDRSLSWEQSRVTACNVIALENCFIMFYIGFSDVHHAAIGVARSRDGISGWERHPKNPILRAPNMFGPWAWDSDAIYKPAVLLEDTGWNLWFNARHGSTEQIGFATHKARDLGFDEVKL